MERIDYAKSLVAMYESPPSAASMDNPLCDVVHTKWVYARLSPRRFRLEANWPSFATGTRRRPNSRQVTAFFRSLTKCSGVKIHHYDPRDIEAFQDPIWRISNLYSIRILDGSVMRFRPRPQQLAMLECSSFVDTSGSSFSRQGRSVSARCLGSYAAISFASTPGSK